MQDTILAAFRLAIYTCFTRQAGALQNLLDGLLTQDMAQSLPDLSLAAVHTRRWPSVYTAVQDGQIDQESLRQICGRFAPLPIADRLLLGGDASSIPRPCAATARDRTAQHVPNLPQARHPVVPGWQMSQLAVLPDPASSWVYVLDQARIASDTSPSAVLAAQLRAVVPTLAQRPVLVADRGYGSATFLRATSDVACDLLLRLPSNRVFYRPAPPRTGKRGRPRLDGARFVGRSPTTHGLPDQAWDAGDGTLRVRCWCRLHLKAVRDQEVCVIQVVRPHAQATQRDPRVSWFLWRGPAVPPLEHLVGWYRRRYGQEHGFRYAKQHLLWTAVRVRTPEQFVRWSQLVGLAQSQLVLARDLVTAQRLPWQSTTRSPTPQQVRRGMATLLAHLGSPAPPPQPRGKSPGRLPGSHPVRAQRYAVLSKAHSGAG
jgi:hypothetical protein